METNRFLDSMVTQYLATALWSTLDYNEEDEDEDGNNPNLDDKYSISDISEEFQAKARQECKTFWDLTFKFYTKDELDAEDIGHNFWLTRNHHGAGFWDGDYKQGKKLTDLCNKLFKENSDELNESINREQ